MEMMVLSKLLSFPQTVRKFLSESRNLYLIRVSGLFDARWYLSHNPDVAATKVDPLLHYLRSGGSEGRDPSPKFSSHWYMEVYQDVKQAGTNPLVHYLRYGRKEGRVASPQKTYKCPVCQEKVGQFLPLPSFYMENARKYGYPYTTDDAETMNAEQYNCPHCGASDRDRLYALYLEKKFNLESGDVLHLLDIAPSPPLSKFIGKFKNIVHRTADLLDDTVDIHIDITNMPEIASDSYDTLICSHVLEHVNDDKKALSELYRVLKPGGWGIIMVPIILAIDNIDEDPNVTDVAERWHRFAQHDHVRLYSKSGFIKRVEAAGFKLKQLGMDYFGEADFRQYGISNKSVLYVAEKSPNITVSNAKHNQNNSDISNRQENF